MIAHVQELKECKTVTELRKFVKAYSKNAEFTSELLKATSPDTVKGKWTFDKALIEVWSEAMQQEDPCYLGTTKEVRRKGTAIGGMECHSR